ncbi:glycosyltransferase family 4 protein [Roseivirga sp.]|uniref:glycosyltransferase family 4 protein n=1 Tax=Roseivirga sp. TaxID=1964215 RepID=UPI003B8B1801
MNSIGLNILLICKTLPWQFKGGIQTHTWQLAKALNDKGHQVSILSGGAFRSYEKRVIKEGIEVISRPYFPGRYIKPISFLAEEFAFNWAAKNWVEENHEAFDIIHSQGRSGYLLFLVKAVHHKLINTVHGLIDLENQERPWYAFNRNLHTSITKWIEKKLLFASRINISVSKSLKDQVQTLRLNTPLEVISNGVSAQHISKQTSTNKSAKFLFIGRLHPVKGVSRIVEKMAMASEDITLDIIGTGHEFERISEAIRKNGLKNKVRLLGEFTNEEIHKVIPDYNALILPSHYETQGIVLLEANAHAIPVIASDIPAIRETVTDRFNGILCNADDPMEFINAMDYMSKNAAIAEQMGRNGQEKVLKQYTWSQIAEDTLQAYYKIAV